MMKNCWNGGPIILCCRRIWLEVLLIATLVSSSWQSIGGEDKAQTIVSLSAGDEQKLEAGGAVLKCLGNGVLRIESVAGAKNANVDFTAGRAYERRDWREFGGIAFDVSNLSDESLIVGVTTADGNGKHRGGNTRLRGRERTTIAFLFESSVPGIRGAPVPLPPGSHIISNTWGPELDYMSIVLLRIYLTELLKPRALEVSNIRWLPKPNLHGIVDRFGQFTRAEWPGKIHEEKELAEQHVQEVEWLKANPPPPDRDKWGGWKDGPQFDATGFFRTAQHGGKWWLVTPDGTLFFSIGITGVSPFHEGPISGRDDMYAWLPGNGDPLAGTPFMETGKAWWRPDGTPVKRIRFYAMNLCRTYGADWLHNWVEVSCERLRCWGFNTIANWSAPEICREHRVPYVLRIDCGGLRPLGPHRIYDYFDEKFPDLFDKRAAEQTAEWRDDPWCIGYFVENELQWESWAHMGLGGDYALPRDTLACGADQPAKREFVNRLQAEYETIEAFNKAWNVDCKSWDALLAGPLKLAADQLTDAARVDCSDFLTHFARQYFRVVRETLKRHAPKQLYLGCRFSVRPMEVVKVAAEFCDVVSFNIYFPRMDEADWAFTDTLGKPVIIGEFGFGATDRGMFHYGAIPARDQAERGRAYQEYLRSVLRRPAFVGCHWFQYVDQPLIGRFDGENYNVGFVAETDTLHRELRDGAREINSRIYIQADRE